MGEQVVSLEEMIRRMGVPPGEALKAVRISARLSAMAIRAKVVRKMTGEYLNVKTGAGRRSETPLVEDTGQGVAVGIGSNLRYILAHEMGFHGEVQVRAHVRRRLGAIRAVNIKTRYVTLRAGRTKRQKALDLSRPITVRAHAMQMNIRARRFMRDAVRDELRSTSDRAARAIAILAQTGRLPMPTELGA